MKTTTTNRDEQILEAIDKYWRTYFRPPTCRVVAEMIGTKGFGYVNQRIAQLARDGHLLRQVKGNSGQIIPPWVKDAIRSHPKGSK